MGADDTKYHFPAESGFDDGGTEAAEICDVGEVNIAHFFNPPQFRLGKVGAS